MNSVEIHIPLPSPKSNISTENKDIDMNLYSR
jgi:hypothetical protein